MDSPKIARWVAEPPPGEVQRALGRLARGEDVTRIAVMPDVHLSKDVCVGVALATEHTLIPAAVGGDIGCGMAALAFEADGSLLSTRKAAGALLERLSRRIPISRRRRADAPVLPEALHERVLSSEELEHKKRREGALQFGTLGRGNHFLELQVDDDQRLWLMVHSGSRGIGQAIRQAHERSGTPDRAGLVGFDARTELGLRYLADLQWALDFAARSRKRMIEEVCEILRDLFRVEADEASWIACHHNFVRRESHDGRELWVHRKGAISARAGELGIIPGSMGASSFHVQGRGCAASLCSSSHGAGRAMSRAAARTRITSKQLHASMNGIHFDHRLADRLVDEAPAAYKDIGVVMRAQRELTKVVRRLRPVVVFKGG